MLIFPFIPVAVVGLIRYACGKYCFAFSALAENTHSTAPLPFLVWNVRLAAGASENEIGYGYAVASKSVSERNQPPRAAETATPDRLIFPKHSAVPSEYFRHVHIPVVPLSRTYGCTPSNTVTLADTLFAVVWAVSAFAVASESPNTMSRTLFESLPSLPATSLTFSAVFKEVPG